MKKKWLALIVVVTLLFVGFLIICALSSAQEKELFFQKWPVKSAGFTPKGFVQAILENPDPAGSIKSVIVVALPNGLVIAYWYWDILNNPYYFVNKEGNYVRSPENEKGCIQCHKDKIRIPTS